MPGAMLDNCHAVIIAMVLTITITSAPQKLWPGLTNNLKPHGFLEGGSENRCFKTPVTVQQ
jgi:hypothetical protein